MFPLEGHPFRLLSGTVPSHTTIWTSHVLCLLDSSNLPFTTKNPKPEFPFLLQYFLLLFTRASMHFPGMKPRIMGKKKLKHGLFLDHKLLLARLGGGMFASLCCLEKKPVV